MHDKTIYKDEMADFDPVIQDLTRCIRNSLVIYDIESYLFYTEKQDEQKFYIKVILPFKSFEFEIAFRGTKSVKMTITELLVERNPEKRKIVAEPKTRDELTALLKSEVFNYILGHMTRRDAEASIGNLRIGTIQ